MTKARKEQVCLETTPYYHCISRCVRRAYICGDDKYSGKNFDHRKTWLLDRIKQLASIFTIDICSYVIMSNHYHIVLRVNKHQAEQLTEREVMERWARLYKNNIANEVINNLEADPHLLEAVSLLLPAWRERLSDISWFMRNLNEFIARQANKEDNCKGHFWEGRFKSQALLDEAAVLTCMAYVDLNPIRAKITNSLEKSEFTSIKERMDNYKKEQKANKRISKQKPKKQIKNQTSQAADYAELLPFTNPMDKFDSINLHDHPDPIPYEFKEYLKLVEWTGKAIRNDKKGAITKSAKPILEALNIAEDNWLDTITNYSQRFYRAVGKQHNIKNYCNTLNQQWLKGVGAANQLYERKKAA